MFRTATIAAGLAGLAFASTASATTVSLSMDPESDSLNVLGQRVWLTRNGGSNWSRPSAGRYTWDVTGGGGGFAEGSSIYTFCIEITQPNPSSSSSNAYQLYGGLSPADGSSLTDMPGGLDDVQASYLSELFAKRWDTAVGEDAGDESLDRREAAAFQLAIWEIVSGDSSLNLYGGDFRTWGSSHTVGLASQWLNDLDGGWDISSNILGFGDGQYQDHLTMIPLPPGVLLGLAGLGCVAVARRRRG